MTSNRDRATTVRFVDADDLTEFDYPVVAEWLDLPAAPYPWPSSPVGMGPTAAPRNPWATTYVDPLEAVRWAETPAPDAPTVPVEWTVPTEPTEPEPAATRGVELVTRWAGGVEVAVPTIVRRVRPRVSRLVRAARAIVTAAAVIVTGLAVLGMAIH